jgi:MYXO-CTERM domain-containing protein
MFQRAGSGLRKLSAVTKATAAALAMLILAAPAANAAAVFLGPDNPGAEAGNTNWFTGAGGGGSSGIDATDPASGTQDFQLAQTITSAPNGGNQVDWRSASFLLGPATNGAQPVDFSFAYKLPNTVNAGDNIRVQLRFFQTNAGGVFLGENNIVVGANTNDSGMTGYKTITATGITVPANAHSADIRFSANIFEPWSSGTGRFDDFSVSTAPEPTATAALGMLGAGLLARARRRGR